MKSCTFIPQNLSCAGTAPTPPPSWPSAAKSPQSCWPSCWTTCGQARRSLWQHSPMQNAAAWRSAQQGQSRCPQAENPCRPQCAPLQAVQLQAVHRAVQMPPVAAVVQRVRSAELSAPALHHLQLPLLLLLLPAVMAAAVTMLVVMRPRWRRCLTATRTLMLSRSSCTGCAPHTRQTSIAHSGAQQLLFRVFGGWDTRVNPHAPDCAPCTRQNTKARSGVPQFLFLALYCNLLPLSSSKSLPLWGGGPQC